MYSTIINKSIAMIMDYEDLGHRLVPYTSNNYKTVTLNMTDVKVIQSTIIIHMTDNY